MDDLISYLKGRMPGPFQPGRMVYSVVGAMLEVYWEDEPAYADQITPTLTVMRAFSDKRPVGVKLYDVRLVIEAAEQRDGSAR